MMDNIENVPVWESKTCYFNDWLVNENENHFHSFKRILKTKDSNEDIINKWKEIEVKFFEWCKTHNVKGEL